MIILKNKQSDLHKLSSDMYQSELGVSSYKIKEINVIMTKINNSLAYVGRNKFFFEITGLYW